MTRETPEPPVAPLTDLDDSAAPSHQYQSHQYQSQQQGCQGAAPALYAHHQHASVAQYHSINSHHPGDIFSASPPRAAPSQATMYAGPDGMPHAVQQEHMPLGAGAPAGMSHFHGVTYNKGKWQASVFCNGRCGNHDKKSHESPESQKLLLCGTETVEAGVHRRVYSCQHTIHA